MTGKSRKYGGALAKLGQLGSQPVSPELEHPKAGFPEVRTSGKPEEMASVGEAAIPENLNSLPIDASKLPEDVNSGKPENLISVDSQHDESPQIEILSSGKPDTLNSGEGSGIPENLKTDELEFGGSGGPENRKPGEQVPREKYSTILPSDLVTELKMYAVKHRMKDNKVVEAALREYLARFGG